MAAAPAGYGAGGIKLRPAVPTGGAASPGQHKGPFYIPPNINKNGLILELRHGFSPARRMRLFHESKIISRE